MIEQKVAGTILQDDQTIVINGVSYKVAPPSPATMIMVSAEVSQSPNIPKVKEKEDVLQWVLANAKDCRFVGNVVAILILGAKKIKKRTLLSRLLGKDLKKELSEKLLQELTNKQLYELAITLLERMEVGSFFGITTFLVEINLLRPKVETTQSGQQ